VSRTTRSEYGALVSQDGVSLTEYRRESGGLRLLGHWADPHRAASPADALARLVALVVARGGSRPALSVAVEHFGTFHHVMTLPGAADAVLEPVIKREVQRLFAVPDPVVAFMRGPPVERREGQRADPKTAPRQLLIGGAPPMSN